MNRRLFVGGALLGAVIVVVWSIAFWRDGEGELPGAGNDGSAAAFAGASEEAETSVLGALTKATPKAGEGAAGPEVPVDENPPLLDALASMREALTEAQDDVDPDEVVAVFRRTYEQLPATARTEFLREIALELHAQRPEWLEPLALALPRLRERQQMLQAVVGSLVGDQPEAAAQWVASLTERGLRSRAMETLGREWAARDLASALPWAEAVAQQSPQDAAALEGVVWHWAQQDPELAWDYVSALEEESLRRQVSGKALRVWATADPQEATLRSASLADPGDRDHLVEYSVARWAERDPEAARAWVEAVEEDVALQASAANALVRVWGHQDPAAATQWVSEHGEAAADQAVLLQVSRRWAERDPEGAAQWISDLTESPERLAAMDNITRALAEQDPARAESWLASIEDVALRSRGERYLARRSERETGDAAEGP